MAACVVLTTGIYPPDVGGPATYVQRLARTLVRGGYLVTVVTTSDGRSRVELDSGVRVVRIARGQPLALRAGRVAARIAWEARRASVIYASGVFLEAAWASRLSRRPLVVKIPGDEAWDYAFNEGLTDADLASFDIASVPRGKATLLRHAQRTACMRARRVIVASNFLAGIVRSWGVAPERLVVIPNAVEVPTTRPRFESRPPPAGRVSALSAGRMIRRKRFGDLVDLVGALPELELTLVGEGPEWDGLRGQVDKLGLGDRVTFMTSVPPAAMDDLYHRHDALLMPATGETFSYVTIEAMANGLPVVVADSGALPEVTGAGEWGVVCPVGDGELWAAAVRRLATDADWYQRVASLGCDAARERYAWEPIFQETLRVLGGRP